MGNVDGTSMNGHSVRLIWSRLAFTRLFSLSAMLFVILMCLNLINVEDIINDFSLRIISWWNFASLHN